MTKRKYFSEFALTMVCDRPLLIQPNQLKNIENIVDKQQLIDNPYHIYTITKRQKIRFKPGSLILEDNSLKGICEQEVHGTFNPISNFTGNLFFDIQDKKIECNFPYTELKIIDDKNEVYFETSASILITTLSNRIKDYLNLEVLYVGQSYGENGERTAIERLVSHSTLQEIYMDCLQHYPDNEILLILWNFQPTLLTSFDGVTKNYQTSMQEDTNHINTILSNPISEQQMINYTEAALIKYFEPQYNDKFKHNFPNPAHKTYSQCYDVELNSLCVEIFTEAFKCCLWSKKIQPNYEHLINYNLYSKEDRTSMFDMF